MALARFAIKNIFNEEINHGTSGEGEAILGINLATIGEGE